MNTSLTDLRIDATAQGLQMLYFTPPAVEGQALETILRPQIAGVTCQWHSTGELPAEVVNRLISSDVPPASNLGLVSWENHTILAAQFDAPMPYGPIESCVMPALIPPPMKVDAQQHTAHILLYYAGTHPDAMHRFVALCVVAGALAQFDAIVTINEEARTAIPAFDLIAEEGENAIETYLHLPIPYLLGGFCKMDVGNPDRPWVRSFANHRLGLPELARLLEGHEQTRETFQLFAGMTGYLRETGEKFAAGDAIDFGWGASKTLRAPHEDEWFLETPGTMLVIE